MAKKKLSKKTAPKSKVRRSAARARTPRKLTTLRQELQRIEKRLLVRDKVSRGLWSVLTALRGPDMPGVGYKPQTAEVIRTAAFPKLAEAGWFHHIALFADKHTPLNLSSASGHFLSHIQGAAGSLGIGTL